MNCPRGLGSLSSVLQKSGRMRESVRDSLRNDERKCLVMTTSTFYLSRSPPVPPNVLRSLHHSSVAPLQMAPEVMENLAENTSVCKACIDGISQWRAYRSFSLWWCASLLLVSEAQTPGWNVSLCVQVERVLCASAFLCITRPAKKTVEETWGGYTLENCIPFCFSLLFFFFFFSPRDVSSQLKGLCFSTPFQCADTPTVRCWNWQKTLSARGVVVPVNSKSTTWKGWFCVC